MRKSLFGIGLADRSLNVSAQGRLNLYLEFRPEEDGIRIVAHPTPGLSLFVDFGDTPVRGMHAVGNLLYVVHRGHFWEVNNAGTMTSRGTLLTTSGRVYFADNGTDIMIVDGSFGYTFDTSVPATPLAQIADGDYLPANTVTWQDQYFIQDNVGTGRFYISAVGDPTSWSALDFADAEASPDTLVRVFADHGELLLMGGDTTEFWGASGAADFPYARLGSAVVEWGLAARESLTKFDSSVMFLGKNRMGEVQVVELNGYSPTPVGGTDFLYAINQYSTVADATAFSYMRNGHAFYQINFPTAGKSWLYDGNTKLWGELQSSGGRHRANMGVIFNGSMYVADYALGKLYKLDSNVYSDNGAAVAREITGLHLFGDNYIPINQLWVDMEVGVGLEGVPNQYHATNYVNLGGAAGSFVSTPSAAPNQITGDIDIVAYIAPTSWTPASSSVIVSKWKTTFGTQRCYNFFIQAATGNLVFQVSSLGAVLTATSSVPPVATGGLWVRVTRSATTGDVKFYTSTDAPSASPVSWTQLGSTQAGTPLRAIDSDTPDLIVGGQSNGTTNNLAGKVYSVYIYSGSMLAVAMVANDGSVGGSSWASSLTGETWTPHGTAPIVQVIDPSGSIVIPTTLGANPQVMLLVSEDRGKTWREVGWRAIGQVGDYENRVQWNRLGSSRSWTFKLRVTDPVKTSFFSEGWIK